MSEFDWTYLSYDALRQAERQIAPMGDVVRNEIGFLIIHQRCADFFYPQISVLHTRLRYAISLALIVQPFDGAWSKIDDLHNLFAHAEASALPDRCILQFECCLC